MGTAGAEQLRQRLAQGLAARPVLREALHALGAGGFSFVLAGAGLLSAHVPLALAPVLMQHQFPLSHKIPRVYFQQSELPIPTLCHISVPHKHAHVEMFLFFHNTKRGADIRLNRIKFPFP